MNLRIQRSRIIIFIYEQIAKPEYHRRWHDHRSIWTRIKAGKIFSRNSWMRTFSDSKSKLTKELKKSDENSKQSSAKFGDENHTVNNGFIINYRTGYFLLLASFCFSLWKSLHACIFYRKARSSSVLIMHNNKLCSNKYTGCFPQNI